MYCKRSLLRIRVDEQADIGADHSRGNHSIQDVSIRRSSSVVQHLREEREGGGRGGEE